MSTEITSADIVLSGYKSFEELNNGISEAAKNVPKGYCDILANVCITYPCEDAEYDYSTRNLISINASSIEEAISELKKLSQGSYTRITLDVTLEKSCNGPKECHTCIYSNEHPQSSENLHSSNR